VQVRSHSEHEPNLAQNQNNRNHLTIAQMKTRSLPLILLSLALARGYSAELGDPAPSLQIADWIKGEAVDLTEVKGKKVVVVEFWATWCGPCRTSIPHLTELQRKFQERGVVFVGVSDETATQVKPFVNEMGDKMEYTVAVDRGRQTSAAYMDAFGENGIPHAFVIDLEGRIVWHGHPMSGLDSVLDRIAAKTFDLGAERKRLEAQRKLREYFEMALRGDSDAALEKAERELTALNRQLGGIDPNGTLDLIGLRNTARFQSLMRDYQRALLSGKNDVELARIEQRAAPLAPKDFKFSDFKAHFQVQHLFQDYYRAATGKGNDAALAEVAKKLNTIPPINAEMLNEMAWTLLTDERIRTRDLPLALRFAQAAYDACKGKEADVVDTYARALFDNGKVAEAIVHQQKAIELCNDRDRMPDMQAALKRYQKSR